MQFSQFRFASVHKKYLIVMGSVPNTCGHEYPKEGNSFLAYCFYDSAKGLSCFVLGTTIFADGNLTFLSNTPEDSLITLDGCELAERDCIPLRSDVFDLSGFSYIEAEAERCDPSPKTVEKIHLSRVCGICIHHNGRCGWRTCPAFLEHIPDEIWNAEADPKVPCGADIRFIPKERRLFLEIVDAASGKAVYRYEATGNPLCPTEICESSDLGGSILTAFQDMMRSWYSHVSEPMKEFLHCTAEDGAFVAELSAINVAMTINKQMGREVYRIIDEFPEYPSGECLRT
ncbi:hypothetical protein [Methanorbis rubei]|uniref:Uncharacterized protein n=1 Tax=Methanorbis rubei TaxID=3028300 RepID=A0AAE4MG15_9EURY|nr:hypothetical protein [Methanocorpusculaceae archaeon Cs1]